LQAVQVLLGEVSGQLAVIDGAIPAFAAGEAVVQSTFGVYEGAVVAQSNLCRVAKEASILVLKDVSKAYPKVRRHVMFVSEM
jgi:hypothetical protein